MEDKRNIPQQAVRAEKGEAKKKTDPLNILQQLLVIIERMDAASLHELAKTVFASGTREQKEIIVTKTAFLKEYIAGRNAGKTAAEAAERNRVRKAFHDHELAEIDAMTEPDLRERLLEVIGKLSRNDMESVLGFIAGENGVKRVESQEAR